MERINVAGIGGTAEYWNDLMNKGEIYLFKYRRVYELKYSPKRGYYGSEHKSLRKSSSELPYSRRGRFYHFNAQSANNILNQDYFPVK